MKTLYLLAILLIAPAAALAQSAPIATTAPPFTAQDLETQIEEVGCRAERQTAAATIVSLQKQLADAQKQLLALKNDPPKPVVHKPQH